MIKSNTTYTAEIEDQVFPLPFEPDGDPEHTYIHTNGLRAVLAFLVQDESPLDPIEDRDEGTFYQFSRHYIHDCDRPDLEEWKRIVRANPGRVFTVDHCGDEYSVGEPITAKDCRGKKGSQGEDCRAAQLLEDADGYYIAPDDATDPAAYAKGVIDEYSAFATGDVWGVVVWTFIRTDTEDRWDLEDRDTEVWGYYVRDYAEAELKDLFDNEVKRINED